MFKRVIWFALGATAGVVGVKKAEQAVQERLDRYAPPALAESVGTAARDFGSEVRDAIRQGRAEMHRTEGQLADRHDPTRRRTPRYRVVREPAN